MDECTSAGGVMNFEVFGKSYSVLIDTWYREKTIYADITIDERFIYLVDNGIISTARASATLVVL